MGKQEIGPKPTDNRPAYDPQGWVKEYYGQLAENGWNFKSLDKPGIIAAYDEKTTELMPKWAQEQAEQRAMGEKVDGVEISIVLVMPNEEGIESLPARALGYAVTALDHARSIKKRDGVSAHTLRIISPAHINTLVNGGNPTNQIINAESMRRVIKAVQKEYYPDLDEGIIDDEATLENEKGFKVTIDPGKPIDEDVENKLKPHIAQLEQARPDIVGALMSLADRHTVNGTKHILTPQQRVLAYLTAHPEAWGYAHQGMLYGKNGEKRINLIPASELRFFNLMNQIRRNNPDEVGWDNAQSHEIATVVSGRTTWAPYYEAWEPINGLPKEPTIGDLKDTVLGTIIADLNPHTGTAQIGEAKININAIKAAYEQTNQERKRVRNKKLARTIGQILAEAA